MNYMVHAFSTMWRIKNRPSNSTSCSDDALRLLALVAGRLHRGLPVMSSFSIWGCILKGYLREVYFEGSKDVWRALKTSILNIGENSRCEAALNALVARHKLIYRYPRCISNFQPFWYMECECHSVTKSVSRGIMLYYYFLSLALSDLTDLDYPSGTLASYGHSKVNEWLPTPSILATTTTVLTPALERSQ